MGSTTAWATARLVGLGMMTGLMVAWALPASAQNAPPMAGAFKLNRDHSKIQFSIGHFYVSTTEGQFTTFDGRLNFAPQAPGQGSVAIQISPGSISTGNDARDEHLRTADFFDVGKFPTAGFESTSLVPVSARTGKLTGMLSLHGMVRPITMTVTLQSPDVNSDRLNFSADGTLRRSDYGMTNYPGIIGHEVTLHIEAEFDRER
jgi:polyisoprenoid-binding protein YceI